MEGTPFGRYRLIELLGRGGMGEVWRAHDTVTDRVVAIKVLPAHLSEDEAFQRRFRREAHAAARLDTPHVVPIHDYGEIDGRLFVSMRLINGRDLAAVLANGPLDPARAVRVIDQVAKALHAAHKVGLIHRDIKPSNILLDDDDFAYLIDFGIARVADDTRLTKTGGTIGTFAYIAPERLDPHTEEDARADIYSLACVLYEALTGEPPFAGSTTAHLMFAHAHTPPPQPSATQPAVPAPFDAVIAKGMAKDPDNRYATTIELADAARDAITEPIARPAPTSLPPTEQAPFPPTVQASSQGIAPPRTLNPASRAPTEPAPPPQPPAPTAIRAGGLSRRTTIALFAGAIVILVVVAAMFIPSIFRHQSAHMSQTPTTQPGTNTSQPKTPVAAAALEGLLLSAEQINAAIGTTGMTLASTSTNMSDDSGSVSDKACLSQIIPSESPVYEGSGWSAMYSQLLAEPVDKRAHFVVQQVVLFSSAHDAEAFFATSAQRWPACANRKFTVTLPGQAEQEFDVGSVSNTNGTLSATESPAGARWGICQRALTVANNVAIDVMACTREVFGSQSDAAVNIARQIAAKVPTT